MSEIRHVHDSHQHDDDPDGTERYLIRTLCGEGSHYAPTWRDDGEAPTCPSCIAIGKRLSLGEAP